MLVQSNRFSLAMTWCRELASAYQATPIAPEQMNPEKNVLRIPKNMSAVFLQTTETFKTQK